jgi:hypothetical protein
VLDTIFGVTSVHDHRGSTDLFRALERVREDLP